MKAKAPEKIYVDSNAIGEDVGTSILTKPFHHPTCTEYIRTDAFIEKAVSWLSKHAKKYYFNREKYLGTDELVEDFKLAMEM